MHSFLLLPNIHAHIWEYEQDIALKKSVNARIPLSVLVIHHCESTLYRAALFIHSMFTEVIISHSKYNDLLHNFQPSVFCSSSSYLCPLDVQMFCVNINLYTVLMLKAGA